VCPSPQLKELRGRLADMEGQSRSSAGLSQLENKIQELEERLMSEERYGATESTMRRIHLFVLTTQYPKCF